VDVSRLKYQNDCYDSTLQGPSVSI